MSLTSEQEKYGRNTVPIGKLASVLKKAHVGGYSVGVFINGEEYEIKF